MDVRIFGKHLLTWKDHWIMEYSVPAAGQIPSDDGNGVLTEAVRDRLPDFAGGYSLALLSAMMERENGCRGYYYLDAESGEAVGTLWVMLPPGDELEYRIRRTEAYLFNIYVRREFRGRGIAGQMLRDTVRLLARDGIHSCCLAVGVRNKPAIRAYEKFGFVRTGRRRFLRLAGKNLPYHSL